MLSPDASSLSIGLIVFPDLTLLDLTGPYEVFNQMPGAQVAHHVTPDRLQPSWFLKRSWWQGVSDYYREQRLQKSTSQQVQQGSDRLLRGLFKAIRHIHQPALCFDNFVYAYGQIGYLKAVLQHPPDQADHVLMVAQEGQGAHARVQVLRAEEVARRRQRRVDAGSPVLKRRRRLRVVNQLLEGLLESLAGLAHVDAQGVAGLHEKRDGLAASGIPERAGLHEVALHHLLDGAAQVYEDLGVDPHGILGGLVDGDEQGEDRRFIMNGGAVDHGDVGSRQCPEDVVPRWPEELALARPGRQPDLSELDGSAQMAETVRRQPLVAPAVRLETTQQLYITAEDEEGDPPQGIVVNAKTGVDQAIHGLLVVSRALFAPENLRLSISRP